MENFHLPSIPSTTIVTSSPQQNHSEFSVCEPMSCLPSTSDSPLAIQYYCYPAQSLTPNPGLPFPYAYNCYPYQQAGQPMYPILAGGQPNVVASIEQDGLARSRRNLDALVSKAARNKRRMARQRNLSLSRSNPNAAASSEASSPSSRRHPLFHGNDDDDRGMSTPSFGAGAGLQNTKKHLYTFCTPDNKKLRVLFKKELKKSDVRSLGRIVLPKKEAEENLPTLSDRDGIRLMIRDVYSDQEWGLKYKYWSNNKSRMYLFEGTGDFVREKELEMGDCIYLYEDECKKLYVSTEKRAKPVLEAGPSSSMDDNNNSSSSSNLSTNRLGCHTNNSSTKDDTANTTNSGNADNINTDSNTHSNKFNSSQYTYVARDEEDESSLAQFIKQLQEEQEADSLVELSIGCSSSSYRLREEANNSAVATASNVSSCIETSTQPSSVAGIGHSWSSSSSRSMRMVDDDLFEFDDCYRGLGMLPEVDPYKYCDCFLVDNTGGSTPDDNNMT